MDERNDNPEAHTIQRYNRSGDFTGGLNIVSADRSIVLQEWEPKEPIGVNEPEQLATIELNPNEVESVIVELGKRISRDRLKRIIDKLNQQIERD